MADVFLNNECIVVGWPVGQCRRVGRGSKLVGCGSAIPTTIISNDDLSKVVDTSDEWIAVRTGIRNRHVLAGKVLI